VAFERRNAVRAAVSPGLVGGVRERRVQRRVCHERRVLEVRDDRRVEQVSPAVPGQRPCGIRGVSSRSRASTKRRGKATAAVADDHLRVLGLPVIGSRNGAGSVLGSYQPLMHWNVPLPVFVMATVPHGPVMSAFLAQVAVRTQIRCAPSISAPFATPQISGWRSSPPNPSGTRPARSR
jgi:hypothetical protein